MHSYFALQDLKGVLLWLRSTQARLGSHPFGLKQCRWFLWRVIDKWGLWLLTLLHIVGVIWKAYFIFTKEFTAFIYHSLLAAGCLVFRLWSQTCFLLMEVFPFSLCLKLSVFITKTCKENILMLASPQISRNNIISIKYFLYTCSWKK